MLKTKTRTTKRKRVTKITGKEINKKIIRKNLRTSTKSIKKGRKIELLLKIQSWRLVLS
jgi:hypothetical protein